MPANTPIFGFPYPLGTDPVAQGDNVIQQLAEDVETVINNAVGLRFISTTTFANAPSVQINNCFINPYKRFRIVFSLNGTSSSSTYSHFRLSTNGTPVATNYESRSVWYNMNSTTLAIADGDRRTDRFCLGPHGGFFVNPAQPMMCTVDIYNPNDASPTSMTMSGSGGYFNNYPSFYIGGGAHYTSTSYDGIFFFPTGNNVTGSISVYGYK